MNPRCSALLPVACLALAAPALTAGPRAEPLRCSQETCVVPDVTLLNQDGKRLRLQALVDTGEPVVLNFIYTSCTTICPTLSSGYATLQAKLGDNPRHVHLVSITIDPERDTPRALKAYLGRFRAKPGWEFLTGSKPEIEKAMNGFNTFIPSWESMVPITMIRTRRDGPWTRIFGLMSSTEFMQECKRAGIL